jgi:hypothetical protein
LIAVGYRNVCDGMYPLARIYGCMRSHQRSLRKERERTS